MKPNASHHPSGPAYNDEQVIQAIREEEQAGQQAFRWFLEQVKDYALGYLQRKYPHLTTADWETILANANLTLVQRVRKGLQLQAETKLSSYYVSVADFATLDFLRDRQKGIAEDEIPDAVQPPQIVEEMEARERAEAIRQWLTQVIGNEQQVQVLLLHTRGYSHQDIVAVTDYDSEGATRNALLKGKQKIARYLLRHPEQAQHIRTLLLDK